MDEQLEQVAEIVKSDKKAKSKSKDSVVTATVVAPGGLTVRMYDDLSAPVVKVLPPGEEIEGVVNEGWMKLDIGFVRVNNYTLKF